MWLFGSRANGSASAGSDWDYMAFADDATHAALKGEPRFKRDDVDLMIVLSDGNRWESPWLEKAGSLGSEFGGLRWKQLSATEATYRAKKMRDDRGVQVFAQRTARVYPADAQKDSSLES